MELTKNNRLEVAVNEKLQGWEIEQAIAAIQCHKKGVAPKLVEYPTGLRKLRFVSNEPFHSPICGAVPKYWTFEVSEKLWEQIVADGYKLVH